MTTDYPDQPAAEDGNPRDDSARADDFLRALVHEMRNFIAPVRNVAYLLRIGGSEESHVRSAADIIERQTTNIARLLDTLVEAERIRRGDIALESVPLELAEVIHRAVVATHLDIENRHQQLHVSIEPAPLQMCGDSGRLAQAFSMLLEHAASYTQEQGEIWLDAMTAGDELQVHIRANGIGVAVQTPASAHDLFSDRNFPNHAGKRDLGINLPAARKLFEMHNGRITVASDGAGEGSEFTIHLPALHAGGEQKNSRDAGLKRDQVTPVTQFSSRDAHAARSAGKRLRVLIVDDNSALRETFSDLLKEMGHEVRVAADGLQALDVARRWLPEFVFMDINMPHLNGYDAARQLRAQFSPATMRLAMMSGDTVTEAAVQRARRAGFDHCIEKMGDLEALKVLLAEEK